jgi:preprotein translocase subunit SecG
MEREGISISGVSLSFAVILILLGIITLAFSYVELKSSQDLKQESIDEEKQGDLYGKKANEEYDPTLKGMDKSISSISYDLSSDHQKQSSEKEISGHNLQTIAIVIFAIAFMLIIIGLSIYPLK